MTNLELFPRGKGATDEAPSAPEATSTKQDGRKRKALSASSSPGDEGGKDKDWLFGSSRDKQPKSSAAGKRPRAESTTPTASSGSDASKGKRGLAASEVGSGMLVKHSGRAPRLEMVSFKKLNKGTLALGVVFKINEHDMVVSLPSSLTGVVRRKEVSDYFYQRAASNKHSGAGIRGRYFEESQTDEKPLTDLFREGQVVRCAIMSVAKEAGGRHIELSLRASTVNRGLSLSQLAKGSGVYGSVASVEDHGYVVTLGLDGVTAFLPKEDAPKGGLEQGQPVEAVIQTVKAAARTVTLSADPSMVASAVTKGTAYDLRSLKPGMLVDTIVDTVLSNGMLVSFLGYFAGCVDHNNMPVVSGDSKDDSRGWRAIFRPGPEPVRARVLLVDYVNKSIRLTLRPHLVDMRPPSGLPPIGALLEGEIVRVDPALGLLLAVPSTEEDDGVAATGNAPPAIKKGHGRRERRAAAAAGGKDESGDTQEQKRKIVGAYVHISRISDERVENVEKSYKPGQKVRCRVTGSSLVEGWSAASLRLSVLSAAVLRYQDLKAGALVEGEVAAVESFGLLVKLGEGVRALVPKNHLGNVTVKNPKARFKVGARVKGRVLFVDAPASKATLTLKRSMVKDERDVISTYEEAKKGLLCTGFVTKVASFGLHVSFYGNVFGLLPAKALARHGIQDSSEAFTVGQVVGCEVQSCDLSTCPPKLSLCLDVAGKTELIDGAASEEDNGDVVPCPFSPGDVVSGVVSRNQDKEGMVVMDLKPPPSTTKPSKTKSTTAIGPVLVEPATVTVVGVLPYPHLGDHASVCDKNLAAALIPGTSIDQLLVLEVDKKGVPTVTLKPLLLSAVAQREEERRDAFIPKVSSDVSPGDLIAGFVSRVESFGVFVRFFGKFTALCPGSMAADRKVEDPRGMFVEGDSVRCVVQRVDEDTGRIVVSLSRTTVPPSSALYVRSLLSETFASAAAAATGTPSSSSSPSPSSTEKEAGEGDDEVDRPWGRLEFGATTNAVVVALKEYGVVLRAVASSGKRGRGVKGGQLMVCPLNHVMVGVEEGNEVKVRVLGVDLDKGVLDVTMNTDLVMAGRSKRRKAMSPLEPGETVSAKVVLAKPDAKWAVAASTDGQGRLFVVQVADFHCPHRTCQDAGLCFDPNDDNDTSSTPAPPSPSALSDGKEFVVKVGESFTTALEGYWESVEDGAGAGGCNPYAGAVLVVESEGGTGKRKSRRRSRGESLDLGASKDEAATDAVQDVGLMMKAGRVPLGKIKKGAKVLCEVRSVHWDRLDVTVAVRYPKSYGRWGGKSRIGEGEREGEADVGEEAEGDEEKQMHEGTVTVSETKKRRREEGTGAACDAKAKSTTKAKTSTCTKNQDDNHRKRKQIVRVRAKVHCTAAGPPGLDAPAIREGQDTIGDNGDDATSLPEWHPLGKFHVGQALTARVLHSEDVVQKKDSNLVFRLLELGLIGLVGNSSDPKSNTSNTMDEGAHEDEDDTGLLAVSWWGELPPKKGEVHRGVITGIAENGVLVSLSTSVRGLVPLAHLSTDATVSKDFRKWFRRGMGVRALVLKVDEERKSLILSLLGVPDRDGLPDSALPAMSPGLVGGAEARESGQGLGLGLGDRPSESKPDAVVGDIVKGMVDLGVKVWAPPCLMVRLDSGGIGRVCVTEISEVPSWRTDPLKRFKDGSRVTCRVLSSLRSTKDNCNSSGTDDKPVEDGNKYMGPVELSLRGSRLEASQSKKEATKRAVAPEVGSTVKCYVVDTSKAGCFVVLNGGVSGRALLKDLSDTFVSDPPRLFPAGKLVAGKVLAKDKATGHVSLTLKPSIVLGGLTWASKTLKIGLKVKGTVQGVKDFGVFIQIQNSVVRGMCHRSQAADHVIEDLSEVYEVGDLVKAVVLKVDRRAKRLKLSLKPSHFEGDAGSDSDSDSASDEDDDGGAGGDAGSDDDAYAAESSDENDAIVKAAAMNVMDDQPGEEGEDDSEEEEDSAMMRSSKRARGGAGVNVLGGGLSDSLGEASVKGANAFSLNFGDLGSMAGAGARSDDEEDSDDDSDGDGDASGSKNHQSRKKAKQRREEEERIAAREQALQDEDAVPETAGDFERLLVATPNDSLLWVKFMAFKLSLADVEGARAVCERGLKAVSFREEHERYNLWVSLINLEHKYGSAATLKAVSERACQNSNPKKVYLHLAEMHEKAQETEECEEVFQAAAKKFRHSKKVWVAYQLSQLKRGDDAGARQTLQRSLQSLARHKHVSVISRFAQNEFEHGSVERGRSVFEGLMASYPKRLDLWNVYVDKEVKNGDLRAARNLLERLTGMDFNAKRMKGVFKKYLQFEMEHGNEAGVDAVKAKATEYVASLSG